MYNRPAYSEAQVLGALGMVKALIAFSTEGWLRGLVLGGRKGPLLRRRPLQPSSDCSNRGSVEGKLLRG